MLYCKICVSFDPVVELWLKAMQIGSLILKARSCEAFCTKVFPPLCGEKIQYLCVHLHTQIDAFIT